MGSVVKVFELGFIAQPLAGQPTPVGCRVYLERLQGLEVNLGNVSSFGGRFAFFEAGWGLEPGPEPVGVLDGNELGHGGHGAVDPFSNRLPDHFSGAVQEADLFRNQSYEWFTNSYLQTILFKSLVVWSNSIQSRCLIS